MTIYTDAAGNKYLGDCRWGNHDINYPTFNYLTTTTTPYSQYEDPYLDDIAALFTASGWSNVTRLDPWNSTTASATYTRIVEGDVNIPGAGKIAHLDGSSRKPGLGYYRSAGTLVFPIGYTFEGASPWPGHHVAVCNSSSYGFCAWRDDSRNTTTNFHFCYIGKLENINTNFSYYNSSFDNQFVGIRGGQGVHFIQNTSKGLLQTGRAAYTISCSDGQTPGSQWATDMWVYDNNAALGYPVIGRVPNMLLGIGTYTYLKPVKIEGNVFPDNGSPWYLPVGQFAGKTLLMRCHSSMT